MRFGYQIIPEKNVVCLRYSGSFTFAQVVRSVELLWADPRYSPDLMGIVDLTHGAVGIAMDDFRELVKFLQSERKTSRNRWAAVTNSPVATAILLVYRRAMAGHHTFEVFSSWAAACDFLRVDLSPDLPLTLAPEI